MIFLLMNCTGCLVEKNGKFNHQRLHLFFEVHMVYLLLLQPQPMVVDGKPQPANKRTKEDTKEPEKKKIRKRSVRTATALKVQPTTTSKNDV